MVLVGGGGGGSGGDGGGGALHAGSTISTFPPTPPLHLTPKCNPPLHFTI